MNANLYKSAIFALLLAATSAVFAQPAPILHDISTGILTIAGNSTDDYIITGTTTTNHVEVQTGYQGSITLRNLSIILADTNVPFSSPLYYRTPMIIRGQNYCSNLTPVTNVDIILEGNNFLKYTGSRSSPALQVEQGSQINISEKNCTGGTLDAIVTNDIQGGAGIGAREQEHLSYQATDTAVIIGCISYRNRTAGGNIVISSGTITAQGGHGAGIGGGHFTYYDGMIVIYGGIVHASALSHAAGIGSGCPTGTGVVQCYTPNSTIIVLPPAQINAIGAAGLPGGLTPSLGLAGTSKIIYIGDTAKPLITVRTVDFKPYADIYVDLSQNPDIAAVFNAIIPPNKLDIQKVKFGQTDANGLFQFRGILQNATTFFTDAVSSQPATLGRPYSPETAQLSSGGTVILNQMQMNISMLPFSSKPLPEGYAAPQAAVNACRIKITYNDAAPMTNIVFDIAGGVASDFAANNITFYASDSSTLISPPTTLSRNDTIYAVIPLKTGKPVGNYTDVFRFAGTWNGNPTGYIRQIVEQIVYNPDSVNSQSICLGDSVLFGGKYLNQTGIYVDVLQNALGCDSIVTFYLYVHNPSDTIMLYDTVCQGDSILFGGKYYTETGFYTDRLQTIYGCDSIVGLHLLVNVLSDTIIYHTVCQGDSILFNGKYYGQTGIYIDTLQTVFGCDSILTLNLQVNLPSDTIIYDAICASDLPYQLQGFNDLDSSGVYHLLTQNSFGCDSTVTLYLTVTDTVMQEITVNICEGETYTENGFNETESGIYTQILTTIFGCDSTVILNLTVNPIPEVSILPFADDFCEKGFVVFQLISNADSLLWNTGNTEKEITITESGTYSVTAYLNDCSKTVSDSIEECCDFFISNILTPYSNGQYYVFKPEISCYEKLSDYKFYIYDRWGTLIFTARDYSVTWNGTTKSGTQVSDGVYYWILNAYFSSPNMRPIFKNGSVTVIRE